MKLLGRELHGFPKALVILVAVLLVAIGLCGVTGKIEAVHGWSWFGPGLPDSALGTTVGIGDWIGAIAIVLSGAGTIFVLVAWPLSFLYTLIAKPNKDRTQKLLDDRDKPNNDRER
jgi:hypothetical protein